MSKKKTGKDSNLSYLLNEYLTNISASDSVLEFEIRFGTKPKSRDFKGTEIKKIDFDNVATKLYSLGFKAFEKEKHSLKITSEFLDNDGNVRFSNIRAEVEGLYHISEYCKSNTLSDNTIFIQKHKYRIGNPPENPIDNDDFMFRFSLQEEKEFRIKSNVVQGLIKSWKDTKKGFRLLNRTRLKHPDFPFVVDMSVVKTSRKQRGGGYEMTYSLLESGLFTNRELYEIEIEIDNSKMIGGSYDAEDMASLLKKMIKFILSGLQQSNYPISYSEKGSILQQYYKLIHGKDNPGHVFKPENFIGPSSFTLQKINMIKDGKTLTPNIRNDYCVTDKADGLRKLCFINEKGRIYFIDMLMNVQFTGTKIKNSKLFNTIFDGEHILHNKYHTYINLYACFDLYFINGKDIRNEVLIDETKLQTKTIMRLPQCINAVNELQKLFEPVVLGGKVPLKMITKKFYVASNENQIYKCCQTIFDLMGIETNEVGLEEGEEYEPEESSFDYETDGVIFTPNLLGVGCNKSSDTPLNYKKTWNHSFKWKPPEHNTIDFLISVKQTDSNEDYIGNIFNDGIQTKTNLVQFKCLYLKVGFDEKKNGYLNPLATLMNGDLSLSDTRTKGTYKPVLFYPTSPFDSNAHICNILLKNDTNGTPQMFTTAGEIIEDNMIVEFKYDLEKTGMWKWVPIKVRYDKTADFRNGSRNYGNAYHVANSNWQSIHNPITPKMLCSNEQVKIIDDDVYYVKIHGESKTRGLRDFHNLFVKKLLIHIVSNAGDLLMDYAVGKAGDLSKWSHAKLGFVLGIDISRDNIENKIDGACARYLNQSKKYKDLPKAMFLHGTTSNIIENGSAFYNDTSNSVMNAIIGEGSKDKKTLGNGVLKLFGIANKRFNVSSIQFALHYMFENKNTLHNFLKNISDYTRVGGYFIGTCFNGKTIFKMLEPVEYGKENTIIKDGTKIWSIKKQYHAKSFPDNEKCVGYEIDIYQETINKYTREFLVNFEYLTQILADYGFAPLTPEECKRKGLKSASHSFETLYKILEEGGKKDYGEALNMSDEEKTVSFLNQYFVYKKTHNVDTKEILKMYTDSIVDEHVSFTIGKPRKLKERLKLI